jgi:hypothetical protein
MQASRDMAWTFHANFTRSHFGPLQAAGVAIVKRDDPATGGPLALGPLDEGTS